MVDRATSEATFSKMTRKMRIHGRFNERIPASRSRMDLNEKGIAPSLSSSSFGSSSTTTISTIPITFVITANQIGAVKILRLILEKIIRAPGYGRPEKAIWATGPTITESTPAPF
ncbi:hypothetical protein PMAYCL1PPCAC_17466 [Pristionchus mayeri]|uniref:Uncharacterized protein n=1 Tax=Pristionchus mayeri TaxID=1317129 RepID=A0AAN5CMP1_9BILA|nr:hypothetical protein PMAYCL1PPCAC_17466 [Pristionchus mayeri]